MVCSIGSVKMTVMARILASGGFQRAVTEKAGHQKLVGQYIQKELLEADDPNLIEEEDMNVFDLNPLTDQLHLVCCNSCKKPVKASQFLIHTERCSSLNFGEKLFPDLDAGAGNKKPPRKARKKIVTAGHNGASNGTQERCAIVDASETAVSTSQLDEPAGHTSSCLVEATDTLVKISGSIGEMIPLTKRPKLVAATATTAQSSDDMRKSLDIPAPLATKMYYSQRNNRLQAAISYMYHQTSINDCPAGMREPQGNLITWEPSARVFSDEQSDDCSKKKHFSSPSTQNVDQVTQSSAVSLTNPRSQPSNSSMDQSLVTDAYTSQLASFGETTAKYHSQTYSFAGNSGQSLPRIQQSNGSVRGL